MRNNQVQETREHKSMKEVVKENRGKIIAGIGLVGCGVCYVMLSNKYQKQLKELSESFNDKWLDKVKEVDRLKIRNSILEDDIIDLYEDNQTLSAILSEGVLQDAITTTSNKINSRTSRLKILEDRLKQDPTDIEKINLIEKIKGELMVLFKRKELYETKLNMYEIKDLVD